MVVIRWFPQGSPPRHSPGTTSPSLCPHYLWHSTAKACPDQPKRWRGSHPGWKQLKPSFFMGKNPW